MIVKIDVVNKLLYCLFEIENLRQEFREDKGRLKLALQFLVGFFDEIKKFPKYENLRRSENCLL